MRNLITKSAVGAVLLSSIATLQAQIPPGTPSQFVTRLVNPTNQTYRYDDLTTAAANYHVSDPTWKDRTYDDSGGTWKTGSPLFGLETGTDYRPFGPFESGGPPYGIQTPWARAQDRITFYARTHFNWTGPTTGITLVASNWVDDGLVAYINGVEAFRLRLPAAPDPINWETLGSNPGTEGAPDAINFPGDALREGDNVLAVEVHQSSAGSSDVMYSMDLRAVRNFAPFITDTTQPSNRVVLSTRATVLSAFGAGFPPPSYQWFKDGSPIADATNTTYAISNMLAADAGSYFCQLANSLGTTNTRTAMVLFSNDTNPPVVVRAIGGSDFSKIVVEFNEPLAGGPSEDQFSYSVTGPGGAVFGVASAVLSPSGTSVTLTLLDAMLAENTLYTVGVQSVSDRSGNVIVGEGTAQFRSWVRSACSGLLVEIYNGTPGPIVVGTFGGNSGLDVIAHAATNSPSELFRMVNGFNSTEFYTDTSHEGFGARVTGLFIPPVSGAWRLATSSDDGSVLFLNPTGPGAGGKQQIAIETGCCDAAYVVGTPEVSAPINLVGGQAYYIEADYKEGTGGDYLRVAGWLDGDPPSAVTEGMPASWIAGGAAPAGVGGTFTITQQPANVSAPPGSSAVFTVGTSTDIPKCYQWRKDGADIAGAIGPTYRIASATPADNGNYSVVVTAIGGGTSVTSGNGALTVRPDTNPPTVVSAAADATGTNIVVTFMDETGLNVSTAENPANYTITGVTIVSARRTTPLTVALVTTPLPTCAQVSLRISGVSDNGAPPNVMAPATVSFYTSITLIAIDHVWRHDYTNGDLGTAWRATGFNDSGWASGPGLLAFEPDNNTPAGWPIATSLTDWKTNFITSYFRTHFNVPNPAAILGLRLEQVIDDGVIYYLNGTEFSRLRMDGVPTYNTLAGGSTEPHPVETTNAPTSGLVAGDNVLAAEVHQSGFTSSDVVFGLRLIGLCEPSTAASLRIRRNGNQAVLTWDNAAFGLQSAPTVLGPWTRVQGAASGYSTPATGNTFFRLVNP